MNLTPIRNYNLEISLPISLINNTRILENNLENNFVREREPQKNKL